MCGGSIINVLYVVLRSQKWYCSSKIDAHLVDEDISMMTKVFGVLCMMEEHYIVQSDLEMFRTYFKSWMGALAQDLQSHSTNAKLWRFVPLGR